MVPVSKICCLLLLLVLVGTVQAQERKRAREYGLKIGILPTGKNNAITDVPGVKVGHVTLTTGENVRTGVTAIVPHASNLFQEKVPAAVYVGNGFGKLAGSTQVQELGNLETPILLTNTLNVANAMNALISYTLQLPGNEKVQSVNGLVGETNDGYLNDIRGRHVTETHALQAIQQAKAGPVAEGNVGAGTGTVCFGFKGGIGTASRQVKPEQGGYTVGILVQTNFGGVLQINGAPVGEELKNYLTEQMKAKADGSCMMVVATDAPVDARNLERIAKRAMLGLGKTGGIAANGSGDYVIAFSTNPNLRVPHNAPEKTQTVTLLRNDEVTPLFQATIEATEEAILNSLFKAETLTGRDQHRIPALPIDQTLKILKKHHALQP
ncbi:P1 family peptidase [Adhaeribacter swui]|uniref:P1 family peptidase n=1 Tax=Adhaeribacter swui TaxID=2086471 RepID=A0A7G7G625_9BACT|nr:P1 family peptidase [Adhaeribacter swui]QNF32609.1 P1 family peptidase [Adhaeribacter swui]